MSSWRNNLFNTRFYQSLPSDSCCRRKYPEDITAFFDMYEFLNMFFGEKAFLRNAAQTFQRFIDDVLKDLEFCYAYIDDILVTLSSLKEHYKHFKILLRRLEKYGVVINPAKCVFGQKEVKFLGYLVSKEVIRSISDRIKAILEYKKSRTAKNLGRYLLNIKLNIKFLQEIFTRHFKNFSTNQ